MKRVIFQLFVVCLVLQPISAITAEERLVMVAQRSAVLGTTVACDVVSVPLDFRSIPTLDSDRARAVLALHPDFSGHVVRVLRGDLTTQAELLLSRPEAHPPEMAKECG